MSHRSGLVKGYEIEGDDDFFVCLAAKRVGKRTNQITLSLTWVCFSLWVLICFKFLGLVFSCGFDDFLGWRFWGLMIFLGWRFRGLIIFLGWRFVDLSRLAFSCWFDDFFMFEVSVENGNFV